MLLSLSLLVWIAATLPLPAECIHRVVTVFTMMGWLVLRDEPEDTTMVQNN